VLIVIQSYCKGLIAQSNTKFNFTIEYSPNYSRLTNEVVNESFKLSHNVLIRLSYNLNSNIKPTFGLGFLNTGELESAQIGGQLGIEAVKSIQNYNYLYMPIGAKIDVGYFYLLPEIGVGFNITNKTTQIIEYSDGSTQKETRDAGLNSGEFNKLSIPFSISIGKDFKLSNISLSTGLKVYYGINQVVKDVPRNNHYFGGGLILAINL